MSVPDRIVYDLDLMRPGCVIIQAGRGCDPAMAHAFDTEDWLVRPTPGMRIYPITPEQLPILVQKTRQHREKQNTGEVSV